MNTRRFDFLIEYLQKRKKQNLLRKLFSATVAGAKISVSSKKQQLVNLSSNDYLGLSTIHYFPKKQMECSSRLVAGNSASHHNLERILARHKEKQSALVFPTGYMANIGTIPALAQKDDVILSDELNHASIIQSCRLADAKVTVYKHNDIHDLEEKLNRYKASKRIFVITEGVFSMDGDLARLNDMFKLIKEKRQKTKPDYNDRHYPNNDKNNNIITILDDAHGDFVFGKAGKGVHNHLGVSKQVDVYISSLSKGLGSFGGYVAGPKAVMDFLVNYSKPFVYTSALPSVLCENALKKLGAKKTREKMRQKLWHNTDYTRKCLAEAGYDLAGASQIIPIIIGDEKMTVEFGRYLHQNGIYAQPIRYPTVPKGKARIRLSVTALLGKNDLELIASVFDKAVKKFKLN